VILISHRPGILSVCDKILVLTGGSQHAFGPRDEILGNPTPQSAVATNARFRLVGSQSAEKVG